MIVTWERPDRPNEVERLKRIAFNDKIENLPVVHILSDGDSFKLLYPAIYQAVDGYNEA
jgi:hypothetical protein